MSRKKILTKEELVKMMGGAPPETEDCELFLLEISETD